MCRNSFILYTDQKETIDELSDEEAGKIFKALYEYNKTEQINLTGVLKAIFMQFKVFLDKDNTKWEETKSKRSEAGKKGMESRWKSITKDNNVITKDNNVKQAITKITDNVNVNVNDNVNVNNKYNIYIVEILDYLNQKIGSKYKSTTPKTIACIKARLKEKFTIDDFKQVIDKKVKEWKDTEMEKYLRPETLFGTKFESYLNQKEFKTQKEKNKEILERIRNNE